MQRYTRTALLALRAPASAPRRAMRAACADRSGLRVGWTQGPVGPHRGRKQDDAATALTPPRRASTRVAQRAGCSPVAAQHALQQLNVLAEVPRAQKEVAYARLRR